MGDAESSDDLSVAGSRCADSAGVWEVDEGYQCQVEEAD